jgi:hypothetical protein
MKRLEDAQGLYWSGKRRFSGTSKFLGSFVTAPASRLEVSTFHRPLAESTAALHIPEVRRPHF